MHRRSAVTHLAATLTGLSLGRVPSLDAEAPSRELFTVNDANLAESSGTVTCPVCHRMWDALALTPAGPCLRCADRDPGLRAAARSDPFWTLSPEEVKRVEPEIERLAAELDGMNRRLAELRQRQIAEGSDVYDRAMEEGRDEWHALQRELHLLQLLRAASRQAVRR
jgi:hypothetical protein